MTGYWARSERGKILCTHRVGGAVGKGIREVGDEFTMGRGVTGRPERDREMERNKRRIENSDIF